jgi:thiol-disulfide isomerase/thioredoxin
VNRSSRRPLMIAGVAVVLLLGVAIAALTNDRAYPARPAERGPVTLTTVDGQALTLPLGKPAVLAFVTATCGDCLSDVRTLGEVRARAGDRATFLTVGTDPMASAGDIDGLLRAAGYPDLPAAQDADGALARAYHVNALGTFVVLAADGSVAYQDIKPGADAVRAALDHLAPAGDAR